MGPRWRGARGASTFIGRRDFRSWPSEEVSRPGAKRPRPMVGHPGLEPGANGLRTQRLAINKALFVSDSDTPAPAIVATSGHSGPRDRYDRASLLAKIHAALDAKAVTPDDAANLTAFIEGTLASRHTT